LNSNKYSLEADFFINFLIANETSKENIFVIPFDRNAGLNYFWLQGATLHYNSNATFGLEAGGLMVSAVQLNIIIFLMQMT
jgi:hypothetical protein